MGLSLMSRAADVAALRPSYSGEAEVRFRFGELATKGAAYVTAVRVDAVVRVVFL